jgi:hypothetical protein
VRNATDAAMIQKRQEDFTKAWEKQQKYFKKIARMREPLDALARGLGVAVDDEETTESSGNSGHNEV